MGRLTPRTARVRFPEPEPHLSPTGMHYTWRSAMPQSRTLSVGMDGHKASIAVASGGQDHGAAGISLGTVGTRQCDIDKLIRHLQSKSKQCVFVDEAGPCGSWL